MIGIAYVCCGEDVLDGLGNLGANSVTLDQSDTVFALFSVCISARCSFLLFLWWLARWRILLLGVWRMGDGAHIVALGSLELGDLLLGGDCGGGGV